MNTTVRKADLILRGFGYTAIRQSGSHIVYQHQTTGYNVILPSTLGLQGGSLRIGKFLKLVGKAREGAKMAE